MTFNKGDRVRVIRNGLLNPYAPELGALGTVEEIHHGFVAVQFGSTVNDIWLLGPSWIEPLNAWPRPNDNPTTSDEEN